MSPALANVALALVSAGLIGALFLSTVLLINVWQLSPLGAAAATGRDPGHDRRVRSGCVQTGRRNRGRGGGRDRAGRGSRDPGADRAPRAGARGVALALCGVGLGLAFPSLTTRWRSIHTGHRSPGGEDGRAREGGLVVGLVLLTPVLVNQLRPRPERAIPSITRAMIDAPVSLGDKIQLGAGLGRRQRERAAKPAARLRTAVRPSRGSGRAPRPATRSPQLEAEVEARGARAVTRAFREPLLLCAVLSLLALVPIGYGVFLRRRE